MRIQKRESEYWIVNTPEDVLEMGPYATRAEAKEDLEGVKDFLELGDDTEFVQGSKYLDDADVEVA